jgi:DNA-binding NarL/FixJ family response regulator
MNKKEKPKENRKLKTGLKPKPPLTKREKQVAGFIAKEFSHKMIGSKLGIAKRTVDTHMQNIHAKTGKHSVAGVLNYLKEINND